MLALLNLLYLDRMKKPKLFSSNMISELLEELATCFNDNTFSLSTRINDLKMDNWLLVKSVASEENIYFFVQDSMRTVQNTQHAMKIKASLCL